MIYRAIGKAVVRYGTALIWYRYKRQIRLALGFGVAAVAVGAYLASREVPEG